MRRQEADGSAVVSDVAVAHGHGLVVGLLPHRARHGQRELRHLEDMVLDLPPKSLVVADVGFAGYPLCRRLQDAHQSFLIRWWPDPIGSCCESWATPSTSGPSTVYLWPEDHQQELPLTLRLIELRKGKKSMYLLTNVLDEDASLVAMDAALRFYEMRWGVEVFYRGAQADAAGRRKMLSRTPEAAEMDNWLWAVMGLWMLGIMSVSAIVERGGDPLEPGRGSSGPQKRACGAAWAEQGAGGALAGAVMATAVKTIITGSGWEA